MQEPVISFLASAQSTAHSRGFVNIGEEWWRYRPGLPLSQTHPSLGPTAMVTLPRMRPAALAQGLPMPPLTTETLLCHHN